MCLAYDRMGLHNISLLWSLGVYASEITEKINEKKKEKERNKIVHEIPILFKLLD